MDYTIQVANAQHSCYYNIKFKRGFMTNYWLSNIKHQSNKINEINKKDSAKKKTNHTMDMTKVRMAAAEREFANALLGIAQKYGKLSDNDGNGIWVGYVSEEKNDNYEIGVRCENCVLHESDYVCKIVKRRIEPGGYCRLAAIPDGIVGNPQKSNDDDDDDEEDAEDNED
jgi:hypothetical protein